MATTKRDVAATFTVPARLQSRDTSELRPASYTRIRRQTLQNVVFVSIKYE